MSKDESLCKVEFVESKGDRGELTVNNKDKTYILSTSMIGLTYYESICNPREIIDESKLTFSVNQLERIVKEILRCSICYEIFQDPVNIKSCLHKFCKRCIEDYNRKIKKECAICRHPIETRRHMKEDTIIKDIIDCLIPDIQKFKEAEDKVVQSEIPNCVFKDKDKIKKQIAKTNKLDLLESKGFLNETDPLSMISNRNHQQHNRNLLHNRNSANHGNKYAHIRNSSETKGNKTVIDSNIFDSRNNSNIEEKVCCLLNRKTKRELTEKVISSFLGGSNVLVCLNCDDKDENLQKYFNNTNLKLQDTFTLEFISRFICYKQNMKSDKISKISYYTVNNDDSRKYWQAKDSLKEIVKYNKMTNDSEVSAKDTKNKALSNGNPLGSNIGSINDNNNNCNSNSNSKIPILNSLELKEDAEKSKTKNGDEQLINSLKESNHINSVKDNFYNNMKSSIDVKNQQKDDMINLNFVQNDKNLYKIDLYFYISQ